MLLVDQLKQAFSAARAYITKLFSKKKKSVTPFPTAQAPTEATGVASGTKATDAKTSKGVATKKKKKSRKATPVNLDDVRSTLAIFDNTDGEHWKSRAGWRSILPVNQWFGILIFESRVVELCLGLNALKGPVPSEIGKLAALKKLTLNENSLTGPIPQTICNLMELEYLDISYNNLSGALTPGFFNLPKLRFVYLQRNLLSGWVPSSASSSTSLEILCLEHNYFDGEPPSGWGAALNLKELHLHGNQFVDSNLARIRLVNEVPESCEVTA